MELKLNETAARFTELELYLKEAGMKYDLQLVLLNDPANAEIMVSSSDPVFIRQTMQVCQLNDGSHRLIQHHEKQSKDVFDVAVDYIGCDGSHGHEEVVERRFQAIENIFNY